MANNSKTPKRLLTSLICHTSLKTIENSKELNKIMDSLIEEVWLGDDNSGYMKAKIEASSVNEIWLHYEKLYSAIRNAKYKLHGEINDLYELQLARNDKDFQMFLKKL